MITLLTIFIGSTGAGFAWFIGAPAPFLTGPAIFVTFCAILGIKCSVPAPLRNTSFILIGISTAEGIDSNVLKNVLTWPISLVGMCFNIMILLLIGKYIFQKYFKVESNTAILASAPGHLSYVLNLSEETKSKTAVISVIQSIRVLTLTLAVPATIMLFTDFNMRASTSSDQILSYNHLLLVIVFSVLIGTLFLRYKIPAAFLMAGMVCSTIGHGFDLTPGVIPENLAVAAFVVLGSLIGSRFSGISLETFNSCIIKGTLFTMVSLLISILVAFLISYLTNFKFIEILIAISPGGLETMVVMGQLIEADPAFIAFHHILRLFFLSFFIPLLMALNHKQTN